MSSTGDCVCDYIKRAYQNALWNETTHTSIDSYKCSLQDTQIKKVEEAEIRMQHVDDDDHKNIAQGISLLLIL